MLSRRSVELRYKQISNLGSGGHEDNILDHIEPQQENMYQDYVSVHTENIGLNHLNLKHNSRVLEEKVMETDERKLLLDSHKRFGISRHGRVPNC
jgi:hypothetical protein